MAVPSEGLGEDFRVIIGEDVVYLRMMRGVGRAVGDEGEEGLERVWVLQWLLPDRRQLLGFVFGDRSGRRMLVGRWIGASHDGPMSLLRSIGCGGSGISVEAVGLTDEVALAMRRGGRGRVCLHVGAVLMGGGLNLQHDWGRIRTDGEAGPEGCVHRHVSAGNSRARCCASLFSIGRTLDAHPGTGLLILNT